ncbi:MAG TPA: hypothetical protein VIT38_14015 [Allosphingosinicella sp.]
MKFPRLRIAALMPALAAAAVAAQAPPPPHEHGPDVECRPVVIPGGQVGCWTIAALTVNAGGRPQYWHVYEYDTTAAAMRRLDAHSRYIQAYGRHWLFAVGPRGWRARGGRHVATIGPLRPLTDGPQTATFMEATFNPGMQTRVHIHPGPEAWVVLEGEQCLETPEGTIRGRAGDGMAVRGGIPMRLFGTGAVTRRALVVVLHPQGQPRSTPTEIWQSTGACLAR